MLEKDNHFECSAAEWDCVCKLQDLFFPGESHCWICWSEFVFLVILTELIAMVNMLFTEHKLIMKHF
jgi:hypothetical protein